MDGNEFDTEAATRIGIRAKALTNDAFVRVVHTGSHEQVAVMTIPPDGRLGVQVHPDTDLLYVVVRGRAEARVGDFVLGVEPEDLVFVPAGTPHEIVNRAVLPLRLVGVMAPPMFPSGTVIESR